MDSAGKVNTKGRPRRSPARYVANQFNALPKRSASRSQSKSRNKGASPEKRSTRSKSQSRKSPSRVTKEKKIERAKEPTSSPERKESLTPPKKSKLTNRVKEKLEDIRNSLTPDKKLIEEVVRNSVSRFEEVAAEVVTTVKRSARNAFKEQLHSVTKTPEKEIEIEEKEKDVMAIQDNNIFVFKDKGLLQKEFGNWFIALVLIIVLPAIVLSAQLACTRDNCALVPPKVFISCRKLFDQEATIWYLSFFLAQFVLACLPLGFRIYGLPSRGIRLMYTSNGITTLMLTVGSLFAVHHYLSFPLTNILDKTVPMVISAIFAGLIISIGLYVKAVYGKVIKNPYGSTNNVLYDLFVGAEINPRFGPCDVKTTIMRTSFITIIIHNLLILLKEFENITSITNDEFPLAITLICILQSAFALDCLIFESALLTSFTVAQEGTGYFLIVGMSIYPFFVTLIPKYMHLTEVSDNIWVSIGSVVLHIIGHTIYRLSTVQKARFLRNPRSEKSQDVIQERRSGGNLYKGGLWSWVRHPNYTGVLIMYLSWGMLSGLQTPFHWIPIVIPLTALVEHIYQIFRVEARSEIRHYTSWTTYTNSTKSRIVPLVF